jgi:uncharacterized protein (TIGR04255 family)
MKVTEQRGRTLPDYDTPPAVETIIGVRFAPLKDWKAAHFGLFWDRIRDEYPRSETHAALGAVDAPLILKFPEQFPSEFEVPIRCWFINRKETTLIQVQRDRVMHNWRKLEHDQPYLHYHELRPDFEHNWARFREFLNSERIAHPNALECEVTYVNHLERGREWESFADLPSVVTSWCGSKKDGFLPDPNLVTFTSVYPMSRQDGTLRVVLQPAFRPADKKEVMQLTVTGQCRPSSSSDDEIIRV